MRVPSKQILKANYAKYKKESEKILATLKQIETISEQEDEDEILEEQKDEEFFQTYFNSNKKLEGKIIVADDQLINLEVVKGYTQIMGLFDLIEFCIDGQKAIDIAKKELDNALINLEQELTIKPVVLMLLYFQMPLKNGI